jgi:hypothetical protein
MLISAMTLGPRDRLNSPPGKRLTGKHGRRQTKSTTCREESEGSASEVAAVAVPSPECRREGGYFNA